tara:strand:+ start:533 stop:1324 length:792 start_codon:yes stop_codon:yes gene_type:complete
MSQRIKKVFSDNKKKLITFVTGGDPEISISKEIIKNIIKSGADIIEIGMPFSDPMADGPTIQLSSKRAIKNGVNLDSIFDICFDIRQTNKNIPIILMGYYNVILHYGINKFTQKCYSIGIDGLIVVDLQPEEDSELYKSAKDKNIDLIRLITPTTTDKRLKIISENASGFLYYITITGITGKESANIKELENSIKKIKQFSNLPIVAGFGINNRKNVEDICKSTDGAVVGSSIIKIIENNLNQKEKIIELINSFIKDLKKGTE